MSGEHAVGKQGVGLPLALEQSFAVAAGELGMASASWLYAKTVDEVHGPDGVLSLRDALGRAFPVLDAVCELWLLGQRAPVIDTAKVQRACAGGRLIIIGLETLYLDALLPTLSNTRCAIVRASPLSLDWERALSNLPGLELVEMETFQAWARKDSALLTFAYGAQGSRTHVIPAWLRAVGDDVRLQFRELLAWDVLRAPMFVYPRWLVEVPTATFTQVL